MEEALYRLLVTEYGVPPDQARAYVQRVSTGSSPERVVGQASEQQRARAAYYTGLRQREQRGEQLTHDERMYLMNVERYQRPGVDQTAALSAAERLMPVPIRSEAPGVQVAPPAPLTARQMQAELEARRARLANRKAEASGGKVTSYTPEQDFERMFGYQPPKGVSGDALTAIVDREWEKRNSKPVTDFSAGGGKDYEQGNPRAMLIQRLMGMPAAPIGGGSF